VLLALCGQLAMLAHAALVEHVTCGADGGLIHVRSDAAPVAPTRDAARAAAVDGEAGHDHCLLDEDGEAACPNATVGSGEPVAASGSVVWRARRTSPGAPRAPLYRLAPKNSPPA
jgi:hypothetical protein